MSTRSRNRETDFAYREFIDMLIHNRTTPAIETRRWLKLYFPSDNLTSLAAFGRWISRKQTKLAHMIKVVAVVRVLLNTYEHLFLSDSTKLPHISDTTNITSQINLPATILSDQSIDGLVYEMNHIRNEIDNDTLEQQTRLFGDVRTAATTIQLEAHAIIMHAASQKRARRRFRYRNDEN